MYKTILVPLDGSAFGEHALPYALTIARHHDAALHMVHVHMLTALLAPDMLFEPGDAVDEQRRSEEQAYLDEVSRRVAEVRINHVSTALIDGDSPVADMLHNYAVAHAVDMIIMTTHGRGGLSRFWLGSVADRLLRRETHPVLLVRPEDTPPNLRRTVSFRRVLIPLDGSLLAEQVIDVALQIADPALAEYHLLRAVDPMMLLHTVPPYTYGVPQLDLERIENEARSYLGRVAERFQAWSLPVHTHLSTAQPAPAILEYAEERECDLIALATHGYGVLARLVLGSVADKVIRSTDVPVLAYHPAHAGGEPVEAKHAAVERRM
jgi:nucleotide-binding universal stress UspA family protein